MQIGDPTLPGPGGTRDQARYAQNGFVATVAGRAIVVRVVVGTVVPGAVVLLFQQ